ncbi:MAG TPA: hypothetical protein DEH65_12620 [Delftia acidovorans]|nr:hypothetical protein [Delftia acidovorans]
MRASVEAGLARGLRRAVALEWPEEGPPRLADPGEIPDEGLRAVENLLLQAGIRLENLSLHGQRAADERRAAELREAATRAELRALHAQVQPHFLFNALNALSYLTETDPKAAQRFTERLADMLRYTVEAGARPAALLADEIAFVEDYLGVARERYEGDLGFTYRGPRELLSARVPPLLLQPLVENAIRHGVEPSAHGGKLQVRTERRGDLVEVRITNTLPTEIDSASAAGTRGNGIALANVRARLSLLHDLQAHLTARTLKGHFVVRISLPLAAPASQPTKALSKKKHHAHPDR